jgi:hypothetical protein
VGQGRLWENGSRVFLPMMPFQCPAHGRCFYCFFPSQCKEKYGRPMDENYAYIARQGDKVIRYWESDEMKLARMRAKRELESKKMEVEKEKQGGSKPGFIRAASIWVYWQAMTVIWAIVKAIRDVKRK